jgi:hypothetical protein
MCPVVAEASCLKKKLDEWAIQVNPEGLKNDRPFVET